ncbi:MAG: hypothetical protein SWH54_12500 [Thermodesulfobacteriota bacterium]|nr:hypothetical protein [Thermodesulfobacteriota bacterium]
MKHKDTDKNVSNSSLKLTRVIRKSLIIYLLSGVIVPVICLIFGWRSLENIGSGFIYASLVVALFGALILAGNTAPAQLAKLSPPKYISPSLGHHQKTESNRFPSRDGGLRFFFTTLICGVFLFLTGLFLKLLQWV